MAIEDLITNIVVEGKFDKTFFNLNNSLDGTQEEIKEVEKEIRRLQSALETELPPPEGLDKLNKELKEAEENLENLNKTASQMSFNKFTTGLSVASGVVVGTFMAIDKLTESAVANQQAMFNVAISAKAANENYGDSIGTIESWTKSIEKNSNALRVFGDKDVADATTRLIDMGKSLGLSEAELNKLLIRTGDLAAGKIDLTEGIEKTITALDGEAESAEFLGLKLNETAVRKYAEEQGLVFKELSSNEKALIRLNLLMKQTNGLQGRAAKSAETLAGQEAELFRLRQRTIDDIGNGLLPLRQGELTLYQKLASFQVPLGNAMKATFSVIVGGALTAGNVLEDLAAIFAELFAIVIAGVDGNQKAMDEAIKNVTENYTNLGHTVNNIGEIFKKNNQITYEKWQTSIEDIIDANSELNSELASTGNIAQFEGAADAVQEFLEKVQEAKNNQINTIEKGNARIADAQFAHNQRMIRIHENITATITKATKTANDNRLKSNQKLVDGLARIEQSSMLKRIEFVKRFNEQIDQLNNDKSNNQRDRNDELKSIQQELNDDLEDLNFNLAQDKKEIEKNLSKSLITLTEKLENDKIKVQQNFANKRADIEKNYISTIKNINDKFADEFQEADPFQRKQLEENRKQELALLEESKANELALLTTQEQVELTALQTKADKEQKILQDLADEKIIIAQNEVDRKIEILRREAEQEQEIANQNFERKKEQIEKEKQLLEQSLADNQAKQDAADQLAIQKLNDKHVQELAKIDTQEQSKIAKAQESLAREERNFQDKLAALIRSNAIELEKVKEQLSAIEELEQESQNLRLNRTQAFSAEMQRLSGLAQAFENESISGSTTNNNTNTTNNNVTVEQVLNSGLFPSPASTGQGIVNALNNRAG